MRLSPRRLLVVASSSLSIAVLLLATTSDAAAQAPATQGQITEADLGNMLSAMGLKPKEVGLHENVSDSFDFVKEKGLA